LMMKVKKLAMAIRKIRDISRLIVHLIQRRMISRLLVDLETSSHRKLNSTPKLLSESNLRKDWLTKSNLIIRKTS